MAESDASQPSEESSDTPEDSDTDVSDAGEASETPEQEPAESGPPDGPIRATIAERILALVVLTLMVTAMAYLLWIVVRFWGDVQV